MKPALILIFATLLLSACSRISPGQSTPTSTPLPTATATATIEPTKTPLPTATIASVTELEAEYLSLVPEIPPGFEWKILAEKNLAVVLPDGWFFKEETHADLDLDGVYVTKEDIDVTGRFSTGLSVFIFKDFKDNEEAEQFAQEMLVNHANLETTAEILVARDYQSGSATIHHLRIKGEFPHETEINQTKIIHYSASVANNSLYWSVFESPESLWEETVNDYGIVLDYIVVFGH